MANWLRNIKLAELSLVDRPANKGARATIFKRKITKKWASVGELPDSVRSSLPIEAQKVYLRVANEQFADGADDAKAASIAWTAVKSGWEKKEDGKWVRKAADPEAKENDMTLEEQLRKLQEDIAKGASDLAIEKAARLQAEIFAKMTDAEKEHCAGMSDDQKKAFMAKSPDDRKTEMAKRASDDEIISVAGVSVKKSAIGEAAFTILKAQQARLDRQDEDIRKAREREEHQVFVKRAQTELGNLPGTDDEKAGMLKAIERIVDEKERKAALEAMKAGNNALRERTHELGHGRPRLITKAAEQLDDLAAKYAEQKGITKAAAYDIVLKTPEGRELYAKAENEKQAA